MNNEYPCTKHSEDIASLKTEVKNIKYNLSDMSDIKGAIVKLTVLQEKQTEFSKEVSDTLKNMNENIDNLNAEMKETKTEVKNTSDRVNNMEDKFEKKINEVDGKSKIDFILIAKQSAIPALLGGGIVYFILQVVGKI